jgi:hypothetical protein
MRREAVLVMQVEIELSQRRACGLIGIPRATCRYRLRRSDDPRLRERLRELAAERRRFGYRRLTKMLVRAGWKANHKRVYRLYVEEKLGLRRKRGRRRRAGARLALPPKPTRPDQLWTMDFASDGFVSGRKFRTLNLMDGFTREALEIEPDTSLPGMRVVRVLEGLKQQGRKPEVIVIDNGPEFVNLDNSSSAFMEFSLGGPSSSISSDTPDPSCDGDADATGRDSVASQPQSKLVLGGLAAMVAVLVTASSLGKDLGLPTCLAALAITAVVSVTARSNPVRLAREISWEALALVAGLFVMVDAMESVGAMHQTKQWLVWARKLGVTVGTLITAFAVDVTNNLVNDLPLGVIARSTFRAAHARNLIADAVLIGVDLGPNLSITGSLATILCLIALRKEKIDVRIRDFLKVGAVAMPVAPLVSLGGAILMRMCFFAK